jgi:hypothetical protein
MYPAIASFLRMRWEKGRLAVQMQYLLKAIYALQLSDSCGQRRFNLINYRADAIFALITGGLGSNLQAPNFTIVAYSPTIVNINENQPTQVKVTRNRVPSLY